MSQYLIKAEQVQDIVAHIGAVTDRLMQSRLSAAQLANSLTVIDPEIAAFKTIYCNKTGRPMATLADEILSQTIAVHGRERGIRALMAATIGHYSAHSLFTDYQGLADWSRGDPVGYAVYCISLLAEPNIITQNIEQQYNFIRVKSEAFKTLSQKPLEQVIELNELLRRFLGICNPACAYTKLRRVSSRFGKINILTAYLTQLDDLPAFSAAIRHNLACIIHHYIADKRATGLNSMRRMMRAALDSARFELHGMSNFAGQNSVNKFNAKDFAAMDLENIWLDEIGTHFIQPKLIQRPRFFTAPSSPTAEGMQLIQPSAQPAPAKRENVFTNLFSKAKTSE